MIKREDTYERLRRIAKAYYIAKSVVIRDGFHPEVDWQYDVSFKDLNERVFLQEVSWVILSSGMRESVVRNKFGDISRAFFDWESAVTIVQHAESCKSSALQYFKHEGKVDAIVAVATHLSLYGFPAIVEGIREGGLAYLQQFPFIGPTTSCHLAKNIGLSFSKPDRHLSRIANKLGYSSVQELCTDIALLTDEPVPVVDIVLWRYATCHGRYINSLPRLFGQV